MIPVIDVIEVRGDMRKRFLWRHFGITGNPVLISIIEQYKKLGKDPTLCIWEFIEADSGNVAYVRPKEAENSINSVDFIGLTCTMGALASIIKQNGNYPPNGSTQRLMEKFANLERFALARLGHDGFMKIYETIDQLA